MVAVKAFIGNKEVVTSGTFVLGADELDCTVVVDDLKFIFSFVAEKDTAASVRPKVIDARTVKMEIINVANISGGTYTTDTSIGDIDGKPLSFGIYIQPIIGPAGTTRLLNYCFTVGARP